MVNGADGRGEHEDVKVPEKLRKTFPFLPEVVSVPQAIKAERCRFLETSSCASVCVNSCKVPSQEWLREDFGMNLHNQPEMRRFRACGASIKRRRRWRRTRRF